MKQKDQLCSRGESAIIKNLRDLTAINSKASMLFSVHGVDPKLDDKTKQSEESFKTVLYLSCWGLN
ncbi:hypothetical protein HanIR_Chr15g0759801 [Helianthus annuus]|nr:hypothetical protein HanIR_Chr15g0759801 [Helianthus annuus]